MLCRKISVFDTLFGWTGQAHRQVRGETDICTSIGVYICQQGWKCLKFLIYKNSQTEYFSKSDWSYIVVVTGVDILQKEDDFVLGIF